MNHEEYKEMLELAALDALEEGESRAFQVHLASCDECRAELKELRDAAAALVYLVEPVAPPAELRARLLEMIRSKPQGTRGVDLRGANRTGDTHEDQSSVNILSQSETQHGTQTSVIKRSTFVWSAIAASIIIAVLLIALFIVWRNKNEMQTELAREREARELLTSPDARVVLLAGTNAAPRARAKLAYDRRTGRAALFTYDLPPAPAGKAYQLWFMSADGHAVPGSVFNTDATGRAELRDQIPSEGRNASAFVITLEQAQGATTPTGTKYMLSNAS